jgi:parvulin-like peptidyl-prolyl isomerase
MLCSEVKAEIEKIAKTVTAANFAKMADKYTEDPSGKGKGGDLGSFSKGKMVPEFDNVAFTIAPKTVSAPVKTQFGYHLILVEQKSAAKIAKFEEYKEKFATELIQKDRVEDIKKLTTELTANLQKAMEAGNEKELKSLTEKYKAQLREYESQLNILLYKLRITSSQARLSNSQALQSSTQITPAS